MSRNAAVVWFSKDLRLEDNPALYHAVDRHDVVIPVFIWAPEEDGAWPPGDARRWWLHYALQALGTALQDQGLRLVLRAGSSLEALRDVIKETGADAVYWNKRYEPALRQRDRHLAEALREDGVVCDAFEGAILHDPERVQTGRGGPYRVFTPFWKKLQRVLCVPPPLPTPRLVWTKAPQAWPASLHLDALGLLPTVDWAEGLRSTWTPGEQAARQRLRRFLDDTLLDYATLRDRPDIDGTARLSPYLCYGELSPRQVWHAVKEGRQKPPMNEAAEVFLRQIAWREFAYHLLYHYPETPTVPLKDTFEAFTWRDDAEGLRRWQQGRTGYPIVDAGMRQLWHIGWMHNRVRMIVASFLTKDLLLPWQEGARWFWDTLVDGDLANNTMGWQWAAGSGADAQPFFRIFNPVSQGKRYDPEGVYVRRWVPELKALPDRYLHQPWQAPADVLKRAGVVLGQTYPAPLVDHRFARERALEAYQDVRSGRKLEGNDSLRGG